MVASNARGNRELVGDCRPDRGRSGTSTVWRRRWTGSSTIRTSDVRWGERGRSRMVETLRPPGRHPPARGRSTRRCSPTGRAGRAGRSRLPAVEQTAIERPPSTRPGRRREVGSTGTGGTAQPSREAPGRRRPQRSPTRGRSRSPFGTRMPSTFEVRISDVPPTAVATIGSPQAAASRIAFGRPSDSEAWT